MPLTRLLAAHALILVCDAVVVGLLMQVPGKRLISEVQNSELRLRKLPALVSSSLVALGLYVLLLRDGQAWNANAQLNAFVYGLVVFGVFEATTLAIFNKWKVSFAILDVIYGTTLAGFVYWLASHI